MSDVTVPAPDVAQQPAAAEPVGETPAPPPPPAASPSPPPWEGKSPEELGHKIADLTRENASYKERFRPYEDAFGSMHPDDQKFFLGFFGAMRSGDQGAIDAYAGAMRQALDGLSPAQKAAVVAGAEAAAEDDFDPYDKTKVEDLVNSKLEARLAAERQEREQEAATQRVLGEISDHAKSLATSTGIADFGDPATVLGRMLLLAAHNDFPDEPSLTAKLDRAAEKIQEDLATRAQELLKAKSAGAGPSPVPAGAAEPSGVKKPSTLADARRSAEDRIAQIMGGS